METQAQLRDSPTLRDVASRQGRVGSIDALRGFVMFMMIFVNDLAGAGQVVPDWMVHFSDRHRGGSGMTFVDLVFPAFLFIVGMSAPIALRARATKGKPLWSTIGHIAARALSLLAIGILMVNETPDSARLGWPGSWWCTLMYLSAIAAFCSILPPSAISESSAQTWRYFSRGIRWLGIAALITLAFAFRGPNDERIISLNPLSLRTQWYGILGLIGWAYLVVCGVYLGFGGSRTAILGSMTLLMCLYAAGKRGFFEGFWLNHIVGIGGTLGSLGAIAAGGLLLATMLTDGRSPTLIGRARFTSWFAAGCVAAALLLEPVYGISKNSATPPWCLWACAITALLWLGFHLICDLDVKTWPGNWLALAGQNVLLAYLLSEMLPGLLDALHVSGGYSQLGMSLPGAIARSALCGAAILALSVTLNRFGFRLRL